MTTAAILAAMPDIGLGYTGMRNRIINGAMQIDQWHSGASVSYTTGQYAIDRFNCLISQASKLTTQQNAGSVTPPTGFSNYLGVTSTSAYSVTAASDYFLIQQAIEAANVSDFAWGTAAAQPATLSFYVYSSLTGSFGASIVNAAGTRSYPFPYSIPVANTWTKITITIPGDTSGTWVMSGNGGSLYVRWGFGCGSSYLGAGGSWVGSSVVQPTGTVSLVGVSGATFYITGIQLEVGSVATPFERRLYGAELALCQRYYWAVSGTIYGQFNGTAGSSACSMVIKHPVSMRTLPTILGLPGSVLALSLDSSTSYYTVTNGNMAQTNTGTFNSEL